MSSENQRPETTVTPLSISAVNTSGVMNMMIPFNCVFDLDVGLIKLVKDEYLDSKVFDESFFFFNPYYKQITKAVYLRRKINPLLLIMNNKKDEKTADDYYRQFFSSCYKDIIDRSVYTGICSICMVLGMAEDSRATIIYDRQEELDYLKDQKELNTGSINFMHISELKESINSFQQFFFKDVFDPLIEKVAPLVHSKSAYIMDYEYNYDKGEMILSKGIAALVMNNCNVEVITAFDRKLLGIDNRKESKNEG